MKLFCESPKLAGALTTAARAAGTTESGRAVVVSCSDGQVRVTGVGADFQITVSVPASVQDPGSVALPARQVLQIAQLLEGDAAEISGEHGLWQATISCQDASWTVQGFSPSDLPQLQPPESPSLRLPARAVADAIATVLHAADRPDGRPALAGVRLEPSPEGATFVATDGARLAFSSVTFPEAPSGSPLPEVTIPVRAASAIAAAAAQAPADTIAEFYLSSTVASFEAAATRVVFRTIPAGFPSWHSLNARTSTNPSVVSAPADALLRAISAASVSASADRRLCVLSRKGPRLAVSASSPSLGTSEALCDCEISGESWEPQAFNPSFLLQAISALRAARVRILLNPQAGPCRVEPDPPARSACVIAPVLLPS